jgi:aryl-alcohol dehydrogenase-like predicted oxidoreductase
MEKRGNRDQVVVAAKYTAAYRGGNREKEPLQSNFTGNSATSMHISVRDSLKKLRTDYIDTVSFMCIGGLIFVVEKHERVS